MELITLAQAIKRAYGELTYEDWHALTLEDREHFRVLLEKSLRVQIKIPEE